MKNNKSLLIIAALIIIAGLAWLFMTGRTEQELLVEQAENQVDTTVGEFGEENELDVVESDSLVEDSILQIEDGGSGDIQGMSDDQSEMVVESSDSTRDQKFVFFYGDTCPYCHDVMDWMDETGVESMLDITRKEVYNDAKNSEQMNLAVRSCGMAQSGVPMMYTSDKECIVGSTPIIDHLSEVAGI